MYERAARLGPVDGELYQPWIRRDIDRNPAEPYRLRVDEGLAVGFQGCCRFLAAARLGNEEDAFLLILGEGEGACEWFSLGQAQHALGDAQGLDLVLSRLFSHGIPPSTRRCETVGGHR